jgi:LPS export ABC transporter protein LptC
MKNALLLLIFILLAGAGTVFFMTERQRGTGLDVADTASPRAADYDYYINAMRATRFDSDGRPVSQLRAERVTHYPDGDRAELQAPRFTAFGDTNDAWQVSANAGTLAPDAGRAEDRLELQGEVELHKPMADGDFVDVRTSALTVFTTSEEAIANVPVSVQMRGFRLESGGMRALLADDHFQWKDGKGTYDPTTRP